jgi:hypothetical protein
LGSGPALLGKLALNVPDTTTNKTTIDKAPENEWRVEETNRILDVLLIRRNVAWAKALYYTKAQKTLGGATA